MHFGLTTPIVTMVPRRHATWEESAGVDELRQIAIAADRLGATGLNLQLRHRSLQDFLDQLDTFMAKVAPRFAE